MPDGSIEELNESLEGASLLEKKEKERFGPGLEVISEGETRIGLRPIPRKREAARRVHTYDAWHLWAKGFS